MMKLNHPYTGFNDENFANLEDRVSALEEGGGGSTVTVTQVVTSGEKLATITVDDTPTDIYAPTDTGDTVSVTQVVSSGEKLATITVNDTPTDIYAPTDTGDTVTVTQVVSTGTKIATIGVNGTDTDLYAPSGGSGAAEFDDIIYFTTEYRNTSTSPYILPSSTNCSHTMAEFYDLVTSNKKIGGVIVDNLTNKAPLSFISPLFKPLYQSYKYYFIFEGSIGAPFFGDNTSFILATNDNESRWIKVGSNEHSYSPFANMHLIKAIGLNGSAYIVGNDTTSPFIVCGGANKYNNVPSDIKADNTNLFYLESRNFGVLWGDNTEYYYTCRGRGGNIVWTKHFFDSSILVSPNNTQYRIKVDDNGTLSTEAVV